MINPHAETELLYRIETGFSLKEKKSSYSFNTGLDGINELSGEKSFLLSSLAGVSYLGDWGDIHINGFFPLNEKKRFDWKMTFGLNFYFAS